MLIESRAVGPFFKNGFVLACERTREAVIVDPGDEVADLVALVESRQLVVQQILLTHAHIDHLGAAIWFAKTHGTPVYCHPAEVAHARRDYLEQASPAALMTQAWRPRWLRWSAQVAAKGGLVREGIPAARALTAEIAATLPGRPRALPTPGHTSGHCSYVVDRVLVTGDALVTGHPLSQRRGPQLLPSVFNHSDDDCARSLSVLAAAGTEILIPGHGDVWTGPIADAARLAAQPAAT